MLALLDILLGREILGFARETGQSRCDVVLWSWSVHVAWVGHLSLSMVVHISCVHSIMQVLAVAILYANAELE